LRHFIIVISGFRIAISPPINKWRTSPDKFLNWVVKVEADCRTLVVLELELVNEVFMSILGELATFGGVKVYIIGIHINSR
jgi:hypothetical protein